MRKSGLLLPLQAYQLLIFVALLFYFIIIFQYQCSSIDVVRDSDSRLVTPSPRIGDSGTVQQKYKAPDRRKFLKYESSEWETEWLRNIKKWTVGRLICGKIMVDQREKMHRFLNLTCTSWAPPPYDNWCVMDDGFRPLWYNTKNRSGYEIQFERPLPLSVQMPKPRPLQPGISDEDIFSKFTFLDEVTGETYVEYIEPLISQLRFPLAKCIMKPYELVIFRGYLIPAPSLTRHQSKYYFDAGASSWDDGWGGPSLKYFVDVWGHHGIEFKEIHAWEVQTSVEAFYATVPKEYQQRTFYYQSAITSSKATETRFNPFLPSYINERVPDRNDYKLFKLDIDSPLVEEGSIFHILNSTERLVDELLWEHHCNSYLLKLEWGKGKSRMPLWESYNLFLKLREKGIRAHSWI